MSPRQRLWGLLAMAVLSLGAAGWAAFASVGDEAREELHAIPKGTWARRAAGEKVDTFPAQIHLTLGLKDVLVLKNDDDVPQMFGPVLMMPGQSFRLPFAVAARHDFACTAHVSGQLSVFVAPRPAWWKLLPLRTAAVLKSMRWT